MNNEDTAIPEVDVDEARRRIAEGALLLDVREPDEWAAGHAPEAAHVPLGELGARWTELAKDRPVVAICRSGARSGRATAALLQAGYDVVNLAGGMRAWAAAGAPVVTDDGAPGRVV